MRRPRSVVGGPVVLVVLWTVALFGSSSEALRCRRLFGTRIRPTTTTLARLEDQKDQQQSLLLLWLESMQQQQASSFYTPLSCGSVPRGGGNNNNNSNSGEPPREEERQPCEPETGRNDDDDDVDRSPQTGLVSDEETRDASESHDDGIVPAAQNDINSHRHDTDTTATTVGVKQHGNHKNNNRKKSNAVGDPDGEGSSDDEADDDEDLLGDYLTDWGNDETSSLVKEEEDDVGAQDGSLERVEMEVEYTVDDDEDVDESITNPATRSSTSIDNSGGGVGMRLGQRFQRNKNRKASSNWKEQTPQNAASAATEQHWLAAWQPHVFLPPPADSTFLSDHARAFDTDGRTRLDRRTLYAGLLREWAPSASTATTPSATTTTTTFSVGKKAASNRKFLDSAVSQSLQAALSLATQPVWRKSLQQPSAIRLYDNTDASTVLNGCTLAMQESIAMALVRCSSLCVEIRILPRDSQCGSFLHFSWNGTGTQFRSVHGCFGRRCIVIGSPAATQRWILGRRCQTRSTDSIHFGFGSKQRPLSIPIQFS